MLEAIKAEENFIRDNLYNEEFRTHSMNTDPYFNLIEITEEYWNELSIAILRIKEDSTLYFPESRLLLRKRISRSWKDIQKLAKKNNIQKYFGDNADHVFIAGGSALATLLTVPSSDVDYFTTKEIKPWEIKRDYDNVNISPHVISFGNKKQLIKRLYKAPHEIIHSFDIDCCAVLINKDGKIFGTKRFIYSLTNGCNTVDFNYFSPSYEWRLIKYSNRGFSVHVPGVVNCKDVDSLYYQGDNGVCFPDSIWSFGDINDILRDSTLKAFLINAKGLQKILIASAVSSTNYTEEHNNNGLLVTKLASKQLSDYEGEKTTYNPVRGSLKISDEITLTLKGSYGNGSYTGYISSDSDKETKEFSANMGQTLFNILDSPYKKVKAGEQTTSTFHKIVLDDPNIWYVLNIPELFEESLYTLMYFKGITNPPVLYDDKVLWFGPEAINLPIYHFARLYINNRIYDKIGEMEIKTVQIAFGDKRPKSILYRGEEFHIPHEDSKGIVETLIEINKKYNIYTEKEADMLTSINVRIRSDLIPLIEQRAQE